MKKNSSNISIANACLLLGGQAAMARHLKVSPPTVNQWVKGGRPVPPGRCPEIEKATRGLVTCENLRPDIDWAYLRGTHSQQRDANNQKSINSITSSGYFSDDSKILAKELNHENHPND